VQNETHYPALVYGTLRPGEGNYSWCLKGYTTSEVDVRLDGFTMHGQSGYPYVTRGIGTITATLVTIDDFVYGRVLNSLDNLEGYRGEGDHHNHYDRVLHTFNMEDGTEVKAWIYLAQNEFSLRQARSLPVIPSGDWVKHVSALRVF
jgi:gamma-glutamylcyclotransferase (GGCT)/AIG2-like uncharacterized protein YtfP